MYKKTVNYVNVNGDAVSEDLWFHFTKAEIVELELSVDGGLMDMMNEVIATKDSRRIFDIIKSIVLRSYGERRTDEQGIKRFYKSNAISSAFSSTEACSEVIMEFFQNPDAFNDFLVGIMSADMQEEIKRQKETKNIQVTENGVTIEDKKPE